MLPGGHGTGANGEQKGLLQCIDQLCTIYVKKHVARETSYGKPKVPLYQSLKPVKKAALDALFNRTSSSSESFPGELLSSQNWNEENITSAVAFRMRTNHRRFYDADRLEKLVKNLLEENEENSSALRLLLCLANVDNYSPKNYDLSRRRKVPSRDDIKKIARIQGSLLAGDFPFDFFSSKYTTFSLWRCNDLDIDQPPMYPEISSHTEMDLLHAKKYRPPDMSVFENPKGLFGLQSEFFTHKGLTESPYEIDSQTRLYGGLRHSRTFDLDIKLSYPEIKGQIDMMASLGSSTTPVDEGFVSPSSSIEFSESESEFSLLQSEKKLAVVSMPYHDYRRPDYDLNFWRDCLTVERSSHRTWETLGLPAGSTERKYYLTEAGAEVFDKIWQHRLKIIHKLANFLHDGCSPAIKWTKFSQETLVEHATLVTMGVASETFHFNRLAQMFLPRKGVYFSGVDSESVYSLLALFGEWGTCYWRLLKFCTNSKSKSTNLTTRPNFLQTQQTEEDEFSKKGAIFKAFADAIRRYLREYQHQILSMDVKNVTLEKMALKLDNAARQIRYLCKLCQCGEPDLPPPQNVLKNFPSGVQLLSYLYDEAVCCPEPNHYLALLYLLRKSCLPYLQFVKDWVFRGNCWDACGEFMLRVNADYGGARKDRQRWLKYVEPSDPSKPESCVPTFLSSMALDIYTCGKTVSLMQFICPEHFLVVDGGDAPELQITFSKRKIQRIENDWKRHDLRMKELESIRTTHWIKKEEDLKAKAHKAARLVRKAAQEEIIRLQEAFKQEKIERNKKKRKELERLKKEAEEEMERKATAIRNEKAEDVKREQDRQKKDLEKEAGKNKILQEEKDKLISYYEELNVEAEKRIARATWTKKRIRLRTERFKFNTEDKNFWQSELEKYPRNSSEVDEAKNESTTTLINPLDVSLSEEVFQPLIHDSKPDVLTQFLNATQSIDEKSVSIPEASVSDTELALRMLQGDQQSRAKNDQPKPSIAPGIHHVSDETHNNKEDEMRTQRKMVQGKNISDSNLGVGAEFLNQNWREEIVSSAVGGVVSSPFVNIEMKHVSDSKIGDLLGVEASPKLATENQKVGKKSVTGQHVSSTTLDNQAVAIPQKKVVQGHKVLDSSIANLMKGADTKYVTPKTFKKIVPGKGVSMSSVGELLTPTESEAPPEFAPVISKPDSVMGEILYGSPVLARDLKTKDLVCTSKELGATIKQPNFEFDNAKIGVDQHPSDSTVQGLLYGNLVNNEVIPHRKSVQGRNVSESSVGNLMKLQVLAGEDPVPNRDMDRLRILAMANRAHKGHHSQSTIQDLVYYDTTSPWEQEKKVTLGMDLMKSADLKSAVNSAKRHPSYSTLQLLMYPEPVIKERDKEPNLIQNEETFHLQLPAISQYSESVEVKLETEGLDPNEDGVDLPIDLIGNIKGKSMEREFEDEAHSNEWRSDIDIIDMHVLPIRLRQCIMKPIMQQVALVNRCIINYFMVDKELLRHFEMMRHFCFMEDGEFGQILSVQLFEKMYSGCRPIELFNPVALRSLLTQAVQGSSLRNSPHSDKLTFVINNLPHVFSTNDPGSLDCFALRYDVGWPCNIVITESNQYRYGQVFGFLLKLKHIMWALHDVVTKLFSLETSSFSPLSKAELRRLHLYRHEMQCLVKVMQGYVSTQVVHMCWHEFQVSLKTTKCLEDLHTLHVEYLRKCIYRCLLTKKSQPVMQIITDIFKTILKFWTQISSNSVPFAEVKATYKTFRNYSTFLFKVVTELVNHGYQPHLEDFLLRLNFNGFYDK